MSNERTKHLWFFKYYDFDLISTYLNDKANQGEALEYIGLYFASYKRTRAGEYEYKVDYIENCKVDAEEFEEYKKTWISNGWEYVDFYHGVVIYRCKKQSGCVLAPVNSEKIRETIFNKLKKQENLGWIKPVIYIAFMIVILMSNMDYKTMWIIAAAIQVSRLDSYFDYLSIKKRSKNGFSYQIDQATTNKCILKYKIKRCTEKLLAYVFIILLFYVLAFYYHSLFFAKCIVLYFAFSIIYQIYSFIKMYSKRHESKLNLDSKKGKLLFVSMIIIVITAVILSFIWIDQHQPKRDVVKSIPTLLLECNHVLYHVDVDYGKWNYQYPSGMSIGNEGGFVLPAPEDITWCDSENDKTAKISMTKKPDKMEVRYWNREEFNKLKSYDKGYKEIPIQNGSFTLVNQDVVYVVYAKWDREYYDGEGYYVFTLTDNDIEGNLREIQNGAKQFTRLKNGTLELNSTMSTEDNSPSPLVNGSTKGISLVSFISRPKGYDYLEEKRELDDETGEFHCSAVKQINGRFFMSSPSESTTNLQFNSYHWTDVSDNDKNYEPSGILQLMTGQGKLLKNRGYIKSITKEAVGNLTKYTLTTNDVYAEYAKKFHAPEENYTALKHVEIYWINEDGILVKQRTVDKVKWTIEGEEGTYISDATVKLTGHNYKKLKKIGDELPPMIMFDGKLYTKSNEILNLNTDGLVQIGTIDKIIGSIQKPEQDNQANRLIKGAKIYKASEKTIIVKDVDYVLYQTE